MESKPSSSGIPIPVKTPRRPASQIHEFNYKSPQPSPSTWWGSTSSLSPTRPRQTMEYNMIASDAPEPAPTTPERLLALPLSSSVVEMEHHDEVDTGESSDFESNPDDDNNTSHAIDLSLLGHKLERALSTIEEQNEEKTPQYPRADTISELGYATDLIQLNSEETIDEPELFSENGNTNIAGDTTPDHSESSLLDDDNPSTTFESTLLQPHQPTHFQVEDTLEHQDTDLADSTEDNSEHDLDLLYSGHGARRESLELRVDFADREAEHDDGSDDSTETAKAGSSYSIAADTTKNDLIIESGEAEHDEEETILPDTTQEHDTKQPREHHSTPGPSATAYIPTDDDQEDASKLETARVDSAFATGPLIPDSPLNTSEGAASIQHTPEADLPDSATPDGSDLPENYKAGVLPTATISPEDRPANMSWILTTPPRSGSKPTSMEDPASNVSPTMLLSDNAVEHDTTSQEAEKGGDTSDVHFNSEASAAGPVTDEYHRNSDAVAKGSTSVLDIMDRYHLNQNKPGLPFVRFEPIHSSDDLVQLAKDSEHSASGQAASSATEQDINHSATALPGPAAWWERTLVAAWTPSADILHAWTNAHSQPAMKAPKANLRSPTSASIRRAARNTRNQRKHGRPARMRELSPGQAATSSKWNSFTTEVEAHDAEMFMTSQRAIEARRAEVAQNEGEFKPPVFNETFKKTVAGEKLGDRRVVAVTKSVHALHGASEIGTDDAKALSSYKHAPILLPPVRAPVLPDQEYDPWPAGMEEEVLRRVASLSPARSGRATTPDRPIVFSPNERSSGKENRAPLLAGSSSSLRTAASSGPSSPVSPSPSSFRGRRFATPIALKLSQAVLRSDSGTPPITGASDDTVAMDSPSLSAGILPASECDEQTPLFGTTSSAADEQTPLLGTGTPSSPADIDHVETAEPTSSHVTSLLVTILSFLTQPIVALFGLWTTLGEKMDNAYLHLKGLFSGDVADSDEERVSAITTAFARYSDVSDEGADGGRESDDEGDHEETDTLWIWKPRMKGAGQRDGGATARDIEEEVMEGDVLEEQEEEEPGEEWWI